MTFTSASTICQMAIISYITKMHKNTQMTFREQNTNNKAVFTTDKKNFHTKKLDSFTNQEQNSQHSLTV